MVAISGTLPIASFPTNSPTPASLNGLVGTAVNLSNDSSLIASIGGGTNSSPVYSAQSILNNLLQAQAQSANVSGTANSSSPGVTGTQATSSTGPTTSSNPVAASSAESPFNGTPQWATVLKSNPALTATFLGDSTNQLLLNGLSVLA